MERESDPEVTVVLPKSVVEGFLSEDRNDHRASEQELKARLAAQVKDVEDHTPPVEQ
jgi:hypothetical protein